MFDNTIQELSYKSISKEDNSENHNDLILEVGSNNHKRGKIEIFETKVTIVQVNL